MPNNRRSGRAGWRTLAAAVALGALAVGWRGGVVPVALAMGYGGASVLAFVLYIPVW